MAKRALSAVFGLFLLVTAQGQESSRSSSGTGSSPTDAWTSNADVNAGDPAIDNPSNFRGGSVSSHDTNTVGEILTSLLPIGSQSSFPSSADSERSFTPTAAPVVYVFPSSPQETSSSTGSASSPSVDPTSVNVFKNDASYSAGTVEPTEARTALQSTALEFSTSTNQVDDTADISSTTAASSGKKATPTDQTASKSQADDNASDVATVDSSSRSALLYVCAVLGLVGAVFTFRVKNKRNVSEEWRAASEVAAVRPPLSRAAPDSQVRVVIDDHNFVIL